MCIRIGAVQTYIIVTARAATSILMSIRTLLKIFARYHVQEAYKSVAIVISAPYATGSKK